MIADGLIVFAGDPDQQQTATTNNIYEAYGTVVQSIWTTGRIGSATAPQWDLGRSPYDPEDCYNGELIACLSQIIAGHHLRHRHLAELALAGAHGRAHQGLHQLRPAHAVRLLCRCQPRAEPGDPAAGDEEALQRADRSIRVPRRGPVSRPEDGPAAHRREVVLLERPACNARVLRRSDADRQPSGSIYGHDGLGAWPCVRRLHQQPQRRRRLHAGNWRRQRPRAVRRRDARPLRALAGQRHRPAQLRRQGAILAATVPAARLRGRSGPTTAVTFRSPASSRRRCATACRRSRWRSTTASCRA